MSRVYISMQFSSEQAAELWETWWHDCGGAEEFRRSGDGIGVADYMPEVLPVVVLGEPAHCRCCPSCSPEGTPCGGCTAGGVCDAFRCTCDDESEDDDA